MTLTLPVLIGLTVSGCFVSPAQAAGPKAPDATSPPKTPDREATVIAFFGALFSEAEFVSKMKPIVGTLRAMLVLDMTIEGVRRYEARMAKQWTGEAGPVFFKRLKDANVARADVLRFTTRMQQPNSDQREATINRILHKAKLRAPPEVTYLFVSLALEYIHGRLNAEATEKRTTQREGRGG